MEPGPNTLSKRDTRKMDRDADRKWRNSVHRGDDKLHWIDYQVYRAWLYNDFGNQDYPKDADYLAEIINEFGDYK